MPHAPVTPWWTQFKYYYLENWRRRPSFLLPPGAQKLSWRPCLYQFNYIILKRKVFTFLFSLFVFVRAAGQYNVIWTGTGLPRFRFGSGTVPALLFQIKSIIQQIVNVTSGHMAVYGPVRHPKNIILTSSPKKYYMNLRSFGPNNILLVTYRSIYCQMTLSAMNYLLYICMQAYSNYIK